MLGTARGETCPWLHGNAVCEYSHIPMTVNQELLSNTKHVQEQKGAITLTLFGPPRDIDKTPLQQPQRVALCLDATLGSKAHRWVPGMDIPRYTHNTIHSCDKRAQPKDRHPLSLTTYMVAEPCSVQSALKTESGSEHNKSSSADKKLGQTQATATENTRRHARPE